MVVLLFGLVLTGAAFPATDAPVRALLSQMGGVDLATLDRPLRFAVALMGAVSAGWGLTIAAVVGPLDRLPADERGRAWRRLLLAISTWYVIDSALSVATGFALNAVSNTVLMIGLLIPLLAGGMLRR